MTYILTLLLCVPIDITSGITRSHLHWCWWHVMPWLAASCHVDSTMNDQNEAQHEFFGHVTPLAPALASCDVNSVVNSATAFLRSRQWK